jgi:hypothetical protein
MKIFIFLILNKILISIDSTWQTGFVPGDTLCHYCGNFSPFYKAMDSFYRGNSWSFSEAAWRDTRCNNTYTGSFCVRNGIFKQFIPGDSIFIDFKFKIKSLDREYLDNMNILILPISIINQDTIILDTIYPYVSISLNCKNTGIQDYSFHNLKGWIDLLNSEANFNFNVSYSFNKPQELIGNQNVAIFIGYSDGWFENWHITITIGGYIEIYP